ncbi:hypothetical protein ACPWT1_20235 [Ramlibacter sp. MMS24-I3-19]|uniref:YVTN family beta-propeller repeat protein n=1 Tax=Ramlibacter sp. MMS24-I3-19 TaxID=3416606 RepID=UPI003D093444
MQHPLLNLKIHAPTADRAPDAPVPSSRAIRLAKMFRAFALAAVPLAGSAFAAPNAYVPNVGDNTVSVIDVATSMVTGTIPVGVSPVGVAVTPDGSRVYISNRTASDFEGSVSVIDTATNAVLATIPVPGSPYGVAVSPDGAQVYVANHHQQKISVISTQTNAIVANIDVAVKPFQVAVTPDGATVYVSCQDVCDRITAISTATNTVKAYILVPGGAQSGLDVSPDGSKLYASSNGAAMSVLDAASGTLLSTIPIGTSTFGVAVSPDGSKVYATTGLGNLAIIDTASDAVQSSVPVSSPAACGASP